MAHKPNFNASVPPAQSRPASAVNRDSLAAEIYVKRLSSGMTGYSAATIARKSIEDADAFMSELSNDSKAADAA